MKYDIIFTDDSVVLESYERMVELHDLDIFFYLDEQETKRALESILNDDIDIDFACHFKHILRQHLG